MNQGNRLRVAEGALLLIAVTPALLLSQSSTPRLAQAEALVQQGWQSASNPSAARRPLQDAEKLLRDELKSNPRCEKCYELLAADYFYRAALKAGKSYDDAIEAAERGLKLFPSNASLALFKGYAHFRKEEFGDAARSLNRYVRSPGVPAADVEEARKFLADSRSRFRSTWYNQGNFYQSNESRLERINPQTYQKEIVFQVTREYELGLGEQAFTTLSKSGPAVQAPDVENYLQQLITRLTRATPGPDFPYRISLVDSADVNAVTPPGHIIIYTGLLRFTETESELAGVLAHELAHSYAHHAGRRVLKAAQAQMIAASVQAAVNPQGPWAQIATQLGSAVGVGLFLNAYSRFEESEADRYGAHILQNAGYNPTAMTGFLLKMYREHPKQPIKFLSTHPPLPDRVDALTDYLEAFPLDQELALDSEAFKKVVKAKFQTPVMMASGGATPLPRTPQSISPPTGAAAALPGASPAPPAIAAPIPAPTAPTPAPATNTVSPASSTMPAAAALPPVSPAAPTPVAPTAPVVPAPPAASAAAPTPATPGAAPVANAPAAPATTSSTSRAPQAIGWNQNLWTLGVAVIGPTRAEFSTNVVTYSCPPGQPQAIGSATSAVIGSGPYFSDSSICAAAAHAGVIAPSSGGIVSIRPRAGTAQYAPSARNSIASAAHAYNNPPYDVAFDVVNTAPVATAGVVAGGAAPVPAAPAAAASGIAGEWRWSTGWIVTFTDFGTFSGGGFIGRWEMLDAARRIFRLTWNSGSVDEVTLSPNGQRLEGRNQSGPVWADRTR